MMRSRLAASPVPVQLPWGKEGHLKGVIDLVSMRGIRYQDETLGAEYEEAEIPEDHRDAALKAREQMVEAIAETDDELLEKYLSGDEVSDAELKAALRRATVTNRLQPVLCGSAFKNKGVQPLLDAVVDYLPSPLDLPPVEGLATDGETPMTRKPEDEEPFAALVFKIMTDPYVGQLSYFRVYSGHVATGSSVLNARTGKTERFGRILKMHANKREEISEVWAGDIAAAVGLKNVTTGDTICDPKAPIVLESMSFPEPVIAVSIEPKTKADQEKLGQALGKLMQEDPTFRVHTDPETGQTIISGMGELHLEIITDRLLREFKVEANVGRPRWPTGRRSPARPTARAGSSARAAAGASSGTARSTCAPPRKRAFVFNNKIIGGIHPAGVHQARGAGHPRGARERSPCGLFADRGRGRPLRRHVPRGGLVGGGLQDRRLDGDPGAPRRGRTRCSWSRSWRSRS